MFTEFRAALRPAIVLLILFTLVTGLAYPALITGIAQLAFPAQANGSLIRDGDTIVGSELIAQGFAGPGYFHPRPSAAGKGYDASASAATNLAPGSKDLAEAIKTRVPENDGGAVPADLVTTSASGLDPHISPAAAMLQAARVANARGLPVERVRILVDASVETPLLGFLGEPRVNVLLLNRQLDRIGGKPPA